MPARIPNTDCACCGARVELIGTASAVVSPLPPGERVRVVAHCRACGWNGETYLGYRAPAALRDRARRNAYRERRAADAGG